MTIWNSRFIRLHFKKELLYSVIDFYKGICCCICVVTIFKQLFGNGDNSWMDKTPYVGFFLTYYIL